MKENIKKRALKSSDKPCQIVSKETAKCNKLVGVTLPKQSSMYRLARRTRNAHFNYPLNPQNTTELIIPENYTKTHDNKQFLFNSDGSLNLKILYKK